MSDKIVSLCYVSKRGDKSTELCRIADWVDGNFEPYTYNTNTNFYDTERDLIYGLSSELQGELGSIGVYEWSVYLNDSGEWRTETTIADDISWCEVVSTQEETVEQIVQQLKEGYSVSQYDGQHALLFCCRASGSQCKAVFVSRKDTECRNGKVYLNSSVVTLVVDTVDTRYATGECKCRYSPYDMRNYLAHKDACRVTGKVEVKTRNEILSEVVRQFIGKDVLSRTEKRAAKRGIEKLSMPSVVEAVAAKFQCANETAEQYAEEYFACIEEKLDSTVSQRWIDMLIENDSDAVQRMRELVQKQWEDAHREQIASAERAHNEAVIALEQVRKRIEEEEKRLFTLEQQQKAAEAKRNEASMFREQIEAETRKRLESFKTDYVTALVEHAVISAEVSTSHQNHKTQMAEQTMPGYSVRLPANTTQEGDLAENLEVAVDNCAEICCTHDMAQSLAVMSFAAYACKQPILAIGEGALAVADFISASVCGQPAIRLCLSDKAQEYTGVLEEIRSAPDAVICVPNGLKAGYDQLRTVMQLCPDRMFVVSENHAESLMLEPASLFTVFLPVFCDYFYTGNRLDDLPDYNCCSELYAMDSEVTTRVRKKAKAMLGHWLSDGFYPPILRERYTNLIAWICVLAQTLKISDNTAHVIAIEFVIAPLLKCLRKEKVLQMHLEENTEMDQEHKAELLGFIDTEA